MSSDPGFRVRLIQLNDSAGAFTTIYGTRLARIVELIEDGSTNAGVGQGLIYNLPDATSQDMTAPNWDGPYQIEPQTEPIKLGDPYAIHQPWGAAVTNGPSVQLGVGVTSALPFIQIKSAGAATAIRVTEFN